MRPLSKESSYHWESARKAAFGPSRIDARQRRRRRWWHGEVCERQESSKEGRGRGQRHRGCRCSDGTNPFVGNGAILEKKKKRLRKRTLLPYVQRKGKEEGHKESRNVIRKRCGGDT